MPENDTNATLKKWQEKIGAKLLLWKDQLLQSGTELAYGTLCAAALYPVIETMQTGDPSFLLALYTAIGTNLIANQIQAIKDAGEAQAPQLLQTKAEEDPAIREELKRILEKLDVIELARGTMDEAERAAFFDQLKQSLPKESLRIIEDRSVFVNRDLKYSIVSTGDGAKITYYGPGSTHNETYVYPSDPIKAEKEKLESARNDYLQQLYIHCQNLPLDTFGEADTQAAQVKLDDVYIELLTTSPKDPQKSRGSDIKPKDRLSAWAAAQQAKPLVILGDPGSGKSSFAKRLLGRLCLAEMGKIKPMAGFPKGLTPVLVNLRDFVPALQNQTLPQNIEKRRSALQNLVIDQVKTDVEGQHRTPAYVDGIADVIKKGTCYLALDGFDEVPQGLRGLVREAVGAILCLKPQRVLVTCRIRSYTGEAVLSAFAAHTLARLEKHQIQKFCQDWYRRQNDLGRRLPMAHEEMADDFFRAATGDEKLRELAGNPMLLTSMAIVHQKETHLPPERVKLFKEVVKILLFRWQKAHGNEHIDAALRTLLAHEGGLLRAVEHLAFEAHRVGKGDKDAADLPRKLARDILEDHHLDSVQLAEDFLDYIDQRSGILIGRGGEPGKPNTYAFPHRFLQEYLAGCHLVSQEDPYAMVDQFRGIADEGDFWDEAALLAFEELKHNRTSSALRYLAEELVKDIDLEKPSHHRRVMWSGQIANLIGKKTLEDGGTRGEAYLKKLMPDLLQAAQGTLLIPVERAEAADALDSLGYVPDDLYTFIKIPGDETIPTFWMGKYPVTNRQYARFLTAENFADQSLWMDLPDLDAQGQPVGTLGEEAWRWLEEEIKDKDVLFPRYWDSPRFGKGRPGAPVVGVSWYEAMAYGRWVQRSWAGLAEFDQNSGPKPKQVRLPAEAEWEKAVGGTAGDRYAWDKLGEHTDPEKLITCANTVESRIGRTTPVWTYPQGRSHPYGLWDVSGNVWKWQANRDESGSRRRVVRGGSFSSSRLNARCANRHRANPDNWNYYVGFRLCLRP